MLVSEKWDSRMMELAQHVSGWSKDPSTKVGAVIARQDRTIESMGYNGFPRGVMDTIDRYANREEKYKLVVHAEANAILGARGSVEGMTLYCTLFPCCECAKLIIQSGIKEVVVPSMEKTERFYDSMKATEIMFREAGVKMRVVGQP